MKTWIIILRFLLVSNLFPAFAQTASQKTALDDLVQAERSFAQTASEKGIKTAFISFLAYDGIIFTPLPTQGKKFYQENTQPPAGLLTWEPIWAIVSEAGDLGYTTGPFEYRPKAADPKPAGTGHYMSIWRKGPDGIWQVVVDIGINHPPLPANGQLQTSPATKSPPGKNKKTTGSSATAQRQLLAAEKSFSATGKTQGTAAAYAAYLAPDSRLYRDQHAPYIGKKVVMAALAAAKDTFNSQIAFSAVAASGDLGYTYGTTQIKNTRPEETQQVFTRIWQKQPDTSWKLILDVTKPLPPAKKE